MIEFTVFRGFDGRSQRVMANVRRAARALADEGFIVAVYEIIVPAVEEDGFEPFVMVNGAPVYVPSIELPAESLAEYLLGAAESFDALVGLPSPPLEALT